MSIPARLTSYLLERGTRYNVCAHEHSRTSAQTARSAHVPPRQLAKSVLVEDEAGRLMAVLPADRRKLGIPSHLLNRHSLGGDHEQVLRRPRADFQTLMSDDKHGRFCGEAIH